MSFLLALTITLASVLPNFAFAPADIISTIRFDEPVVGEVCLQLEAMTPETPLLFRESCEGISGARAKQVRWRGVPAGEYRLRATFRGGNTTLISQYVPLVVRDPY